MKKIIAIIFSIVFCGIVSPASEYLNNWTENTNNLVFSAHDGKAYYPSIIKDQNHNTYTMWYTRSDGIHIASSTNGVDWGERNNGHAIIGLTNPHHVVVKQEDSMYKMWYWDTSKLYTVESIRYAESTDGITWSHDTAISQSHFKPIITGKSGDWNRGSYGPSDILINPDAKNRGRNPFDYSYVMYYDATTGGQQDIGIGYSSDGINWNRYGRNNNSIALEHAGSGWDATHVGRCSVYRADDGLFHMWYSGGNGSVDEGIGYAISQDGLDWSRYPQGDSNVVFSVDDSISWRNESTYTPVVIDGKEMWFTGGSGSNKTIGYANNVPEPVTSFLVIIFGIGFIVLRRIFMV